MKLAAYFEDSSQIGPGKVKFLDRIVFIIHRLLQVPAERPVATAVPSETGADQSGVHRGERSTAAGQRSVPERAKLAGTGPNRPFAAGLLAGQNAAGFSPGLRLVAASQQSLGEMKCPGEAAASAVRHSGACGGGRFPSGPQIQKKGGPCRFGESDLRNRIGRDTARSQRFGGFFPLATAECERKLFSPATRRVTEETETTESFVCQNDADQAIRRRKRTRPTNAPTESKPMVPGSGTPAKAAAAAPCCAEVMP